MAIELYPGDIRDDLAFKNINHIPEGERTTNRFSIREPVNNDFLKVEPDRIEFTSGDYRLTKTYAIITEPELMPGNYWLDIAISHSWSDGGVANYERKIKILSPSCSV